MTIEEIKTAEDFNEWILQDIFEQAKREFLILIQKKERMPRKDKKKFKKLISTL